MLLEEGLQHALEVQGVSLRLGGVEVAGTLTRGDGSTEALDGTALRAAPEAALRLLSIGVPMLATATIVAKVR